MRTIKPATEINALIAEAVANAGDVCDDVELWSVQWHEPDETGCNWSMPGASGATNWRECLPAVEPYVTTLMEQFNIPEPD